MEDITWVTMVEASQKTGIQYDHIRNLRKLGLLRWKKPKFPKAKQGALLLVSLEDVRAAKRIKEQPES